MRERVVERRVVVLRAAGFRVAVLRAGDAVLLDEALLARLAAGLRAVDLRAVVLRLAPPVFRVPVERDEAPLLLLDALLRGAASVSAHLPDITRWAASATASAMIDPNLVALDIMLVAACEAVSAASRPASRILRRADGLALIAAAAAASPAASISLLIAALANLSTGLSPDVDRLEVFRVDFAIAFTPYRRTKITVGP